MKFHLFTKLSQQKYYFVVFVVTIIVSLIIYYIKVIDKQITVVYAEIERPSVTQPLLIELPKGVDIIDLQVNVHGNYSCVKTKYLLRLVRTTICLHGDIDAISRIIRNERIWEEPFLIELFSLLLRYPEMSFIDAGANIGTYTMFAASFGRTVISIECFKPNINLIRKAVQIEKVHDKVILFGNAIFNETGKYLKIKSDPYNVGSQAIVSDSNMSISKDDIYVVKTMRFDAILPILQQRNIRNAIMKVDIQWSEVFLCETGDAVFDYVNIPVILMEWDPVPHFTDRIRKVLEYFMKRGYLPTADMCKQLNASDALQSWPGDIYWVKLNQSEIC